MKNKLFSKIKNFQVFESKNPREWFISFLTLIPKLPPEFSFHLEKLEKSQGRRTSSTGEWAETVTIENDLHGAGWSIVAKNRILALTATGTGLNTGNTALATGLLAK